MVRILLSAFSIMLAMIVFLAGNVYAKPFIISPDNLGIDAPWAQFSIKIDIDKKCYKAGENLKATIASNRDCHILVYYTNENGSCLILYPNRFESKSFIKAGESFTIGNDPKIFKLKIDTPRSRDYIQVIGTDEPIDTSSLSGIKNPEEFVNKLRLILKERVEDRARKLGAASGLLDLSLISVDKSIFAIATVDYLCNYPSYSKPEKIQKPALPEVKNSETETPLIEIRSVDIDKQSSQIVGPDAPISNTSSEKGNEFTVNSETAEIRGTVQYRKGVKKVLINGEEPIIRRIGSSRDIVIESESEPEQQKVPEKILKTVDFIYTLKGINQSPSPVTITAEGIDGKKGSHTINVKRGK